MREISSPLVGREAEIGRLNRFIERLRGGAGGVVHLVGPSGIGKSRLVEEFKKSDILDGVAVLEGGAISMGVNIPFHPFAHLLRGWAGIRGNDDPTVAYSKIRAALALFFAERINEVLPFVATAMGLALPGRDASRLADIEGSARESLIMKNMRDLFGRIADATPLLVIIEDSHWIDPSSRELMSSLYRLVPHTRILFIVVYIPDYQEATCGIEETAATIDTGSFARIELGPLTDGQSRRLIANLLNTKALPQGIFGTVIAKSKGSPLFLEEAIRYLIGEGAVTYEGGSYLAGNKIRKTVIPDTLRDLLRARLSQLDAGTQELIRITSVLGKNIMSRVLNEISASQGNVAVKVESVRGGELLHRRREIERDNLFKHALGQETAYGSMMKDQQKELHLKVANTIERVFGRRLHEFYGILAYHYSVAGSDVKAKEYLIKAGSEAMESAAFTEALSCFQEAYLIHQRQPAEIRARDEEIVILKNTAAALYYLGRYEESLDFFTEILSEWGEEEPRNRFMRGVRVLIGFISFLISIYLPVLKWRKIPQDHDEEFIKLFYMKASALANVDSIRFFLEAFYFIRRFVNFNITRIDNGTAMFAGYSAVFSWTGVSFSLSGKVLAFVKEKVKTSDLRSIMYYEITRMIHDFFVGRWKENIFDENTLRQNLALGEVTNSVNYITLHCQFALEKGDFEGARKLLEELLEVASNYNNTYAMAYWFTLRIKTLMKSQAFMDVHKTIDDGLEYLEKNDLKILLALIYSTKAQAQALTGDLSGSAVSLSYAQEYREAIRRLPYYELRFLIAAITRELCCIEGSSIDDGTTYQEEARSKIDRWAADAIKLARADASARTMLFHLIGRYNWMTGRQRKALVWWDKSIEEGERLGALPDLAWTYQEIGRRLSERGSRYKELKGMSAEAYLMKARNIYTDVGLEKKKDKVA